jgi:ubiquinone/menaquinone biosynthesis C-methylase UbiE
MSLFDPRAVRRTYDTVAGEYAAAFADDLDRLPFDRQFLDDVAERSPGRGPLLDIGCGPAQVATYLAARGMSVFGIDLSPGMLGVARTRNTELPLTAADVRHLPLRARSCAGAVAFYSLHNLIRPDFPRALRELRRVLTSGAPLALAMHLGEGELSVGTEWLGHEVEAVGFALYSQEQITEALVDLAFDVELVRQRGPLPHEYQGPRIYLLASAP